MGISNVAWGMMPFAQRAALSKGVRSGTGKRRRTKAKRKTTRKATKRRATKGRKMKFGSPAWQKKYKVGKYRK